LGQQTLGGSADAGAPLEGGQFQVRPKLDLRVIKKKFPAVADGLMNNETDVQPEGMMIIFHSIIMGTGHFEAG
jgi:hypothetical protein